MFCNGKSRAQLFYIYCWIFLIISISLANLIETTDASFYNDEHDEDFMLQRESVLEKSYHGLIRENETLVEITPLIQVDEEKICSFRILKKSFHDVPFEIEIFNNMGIMKARHALNCEKRKIYHFKILAVFCDSSISAPANVHVNVVDVNEFAPIFSQSYFEIEVDQHILNKEILRVEATDKDCTPLYGDICKYDILNKDQPFIINNEGVISNTEYLTHDYILNIVAYDCAMKQSAPIMVKVKLRNSCVPSLKNIDLHINYTSLDSKSLALFPNAEVELCGMKCDKGNMNVHTSIILETNHISFGCDRDSLDCTTLNKSEEDKIDRRNVKYLNIKNDKHYLNLFTKATHWIQNITYDKSLQPIFHFDGNTGIQVLDTVLSQYDFASKPFSLITAFRHAPLKYISSRVTAENNKRDLKHIKEHIICSSDDHKMNRHHMALFVRNCRLILLLRKNFNEGDLNIFSPAEWRWKIPQVCDNKWHQYVLNIDVNESMAIKVDLYIDGMLFEQAHEDQHNNPEIIDDWPLHASFGVKTKLSLGACYQSSENQFKHTFVGDISVVKIALNQILSTAQIKCLIDCVEHLVPPNESYLAADTQLQLNTQRNEIFIETKNIQNLAVLIKEVKYVNKKLKQSLGRRKIEIRSTINCSNKNFIHLPTVYAYVMVHMPTITKNTSIKKEITSTDAPFHDVDSNMLAPIEEIGAAVKAQLDKTGEYENEHDDNRISQIIITGEINKLVSYKEIKLGVRIFNDVNLTLTKVQNDNIRIKYLNSCNVIIFPSLNPDHEDISFDNDDSLTSQLNLKTNINKEGVEMFGHDTLINYLSILRSLIYMNKKPAYYLNRVFKLNCRLIDEEKLLKSGEYTLTLTVLHPKQSGTSTTAPILGAATKSIQLINEGDQQGGVSAHSMINPHIAEESEAQLHSIFHKADATHSTFLIAVMCLLLMTILCGLLVLRVRNKNNKLSLQHCPKILDDSLAWDDSALTITINPMQNDTLSDESTDSENSDSDDENGLKARYPNINQLEWDNSNIFTSPIN